MEGKIVKIGFLKKIWYSITKFEQYPAMATEGLKRAVKYLLEISLIIAISMMICSLFEMKDMILDFANYVQENIPEFTYSKGIISMDNPQNIIIEETEKMGIEQILINTQIETDEEIEQIKKENLKNGINLFLFKDKIILEAQFEENQAIEQKYTYEEIITNLLGENMDSFTKNDFVQYLSSGKMTTFYSTYALTSFFYYFAENIIIVLVYSLEIALLGWITTIILGMRIKFKALYCMASYAITLPTILMAFYMIANYLTGFTIRDFEIAYIAISYIYLVATLFILKDDFIKKMQEVERIKQEQQIVKKEIKEKEEREEKKEEGEPQQKENEEDEPNGSEA